MATTIARAAAGDNCAAVDHVDATAERGIGCKDHISAFGDRDAFTGERRLIDGQIIGFDQARIGRRRHAALQNDDIARDEFFAWQVIFSACAHHARNRFCATAETGNGFLSPIFGKKTYSSVDQHDAENNHTIGNAAGCNRQNG